MSDVVRQVRIALRGSRRTPAFALGTVLMLGLGIGAAAAMVAVFRAVLVERLPVLDPERVLVLSTYKDPAVEFGLGTSDLKEIARQSRTLSAVGGFVHWGATPFPMLDGDRSVVMYRTLVSGDFFDVIGARAVVGRLLRAEDDLPGAPLALVLSYGVWQQQFGGDLTVVGHRLLAPYAQATYTVVGVAPPGLDYPSGAGYWIPLWQGGNQSVIAVARLAPDATLASARAEVFAIKSRLSPELHLVGAHRQPSSVKASAFS
ncbi:MAG TPA: ABC transporter permease [Gemmatimonadaceae bacterium]